MAEAELATIARPYARAAFSHALDRPDGLEIWSKMLALLSAAAKASAVRVALDNPMISTGETVSLLTDLLGEELNTEAENFLSVLASYGRIGLLPNIAELYELLKANHEKTMEVEVTSAFEVSEAEKVSLAEALQKRLKRNVTIETKIDNGLLGGVIIRAEDTVIDDSVRGKLQKLSHALD